MTQKNDTQSPGLNLTQSTVLTYLDTLLGEPEPDRENTEGNGLGQEKSGSFGMKHASNHQRHGE